jgi:anti-sigma-K factor RskA
MRPELSHEEAFAELDAVAFDLLDRVERDAIMQHVGTCAACRAELDALQETVTDLAFAAPAAAEAVSASRGRVRERLLARAAVDTQARKPSATPLVFPVTSPVAPGASNAGNRRAQWFAIAAGILFVASLGLFGASFNGRQDVVTALKTEVARSESARRSADSLSDLLAARDSLLAGIVGRDVSVMTLTSRAAKDPYARMFWDRVRHSWTMIAHNMPELKSGRTYQLWLVTPTSKISAGTFVVRNGDAVVRATYDLTEPLNAIAVTDEPAGGVPQPTGPVVVAAQTK